MIPISLTAAVVLFVLSGVLHLLMRRTRDDLFKGPYPIDHTRFGIAQKRVRRLYVLSSAASGAGVGQLIVALGAFLANALLNWNL